MPPTPLPDGDACSADELNEQIRALFVHRDVRLTDEQRETYRTLLAQLREIEREDVVEAA